MSATFPKGSVVKLRSGGPRMTVDGPDSRGALICSWFAGGERKQDTFEPEGLEEYREPGPVKIIF